MGKVGAALNQLYADYRTDARRRGRKYEFALTKDEFRALTSANCHYCALPPQRKVVSRAGEVYIFNGIDRVDNSKGYIRENCVPCCKMCNRAKDTYSVAEFIAWARRVVEVACQQTQK